MHIELQQSIKSILLFFGMIFMSCIFDDDPKSFFIASCLSSEGLWCVDYIGEPSPDNQASAFALCFVRPRGWSLDYKNSCAPSNTPPNCEIPWREEESGEIQFVARHYIDESLGLTCESVEVPD